MPKPPPGPPAAAVLEGGMAEAIIGCALVRILEDLVGLVDLLEASLAGLVPRIAVGMPFHRQLAKRGFQLPIVDGALDLENFVIAPLGHPRVPSRRSCRSRPRRPYLFTHGGSKTCTPGAGSGGVVCNGSAGMPAASCRGSGRLLVLLVVVDLGELRVDDVLLLAAGTRSSYRPAHRTPPHSPAPVCTWPRRASSRPAPAHSSWR